MLEDTSLPVLADGMKFMLKEGMVCESFWKLHNILSFLVLERKRKYQSTTMILLMMKSDVNGKS